ncbi:MAG TPA: hypothetical protein PK079_20670 [Leptospiraceae bacterium]|nr:hypothetical protein [Leptospiraceae bacterium]HMW06378.1 hypothetical protein [Leptospiraceae bacterium]HMX31710.1 hypothetical protein [Leptospiraceae bacterium]HMY31996.1 hypothetical protein [Leptospiraceae bacterium]HMZ65791.1 hypothetical protein [Leptospiraceae bacterium]
MNRFLFISLLITVAAFSRLLPHPGNFTPVMAIALFSGATILSKRESLLVPFLAMLISDAIIGFHSLIPVVYACMAVITIMGWYLKDNRSFSRTLGFSLIGAVLFFIVTNFGVWATSGMYEKSLNGLIQCYILAIPFFQNTLASTLIYSLVLFGAILLFEKIQTQSFAKATIPVDNKKRS